MGSVTLHRVVNEALCEEVNTWIIFSNTFLFNQYIGCIYLIIFSLA